MNFMGVGPLELLVILVLALVVFGPDKLPEIARNLGKAVSEFQRMSSELTRELTVQLDEEVQAKKEASTSTPALPAATGPAAADSVAPAETTEPAVGSVPEVAQEPEIAPEPVPAEAPTIPVEPAAGAFRRRTRRQSNFRPAPEAVGAASAAEDQTSEAASAVSIEAPATVEAGSSVAPDTAVPSNGPGQGEGLPDATSAAPAAAASTVAKEADAAQAVDAQTAPRKRARRAAAKAEASSEVAGATMPDGPLGEPSPSSERPA